MSAIQKVKKAKKQVGQKATRQVPEQNSTSYANTLEKNIPCRGNSKYLYVPGLFKAYQGQSVRLG